MKNTYLHRIGLLVLLLALARSGWAQDPAYSQYYNTPYQTNPAMLSFRPDAVIGVNFRSQWSGLTVPYTDYLISGYYPILSKNKLRQYGAAGGFVQSDRQPGKFNTTSLGIAGAYKLPLNYANYVHFGIQLGFLMRSINTDGLSTGSQVNNGYYDPSRPTLENLGQTKSAPTIGLGTSWVNEDVDGDIRGQVGIAAYHLNQPDVSFISGKFDNLKPSFIFTGTVRAVKADQFSIYPGVRYILQGPAHKLNVGGLARFGINPGNPYGGGGGNSLLQPGTFGFGLFYQTNDASALIGTVELVQPRYAVSFNYDFGMGSLKDGNTRGNAAELFLCYRRTLGKRRKIDLRYYKTDKTLDNGTAPSEGNSTGEPTPATPETPAPPVEAPAPAPAPSPAPTPAAPSAAPAPAPSAPAPAGVPGAPARSTAAPAKASPKAKATSKASVKGKTGAKATAKAKPAAKKPAAKPKK